MQLFKNKIKKLEMQTILLSFVLGITVLMMLHDYLASVLFNQSYYLSESLLFKINIVLLIIPIVIFGVINDFKFTKEINVSKIMIYLIPMVITHIVLASLLIAFISHNLMQSPYTFNFLIKNKFNQDFIFLITIYGLMFLIARYYSLNVQSKKIKSIETLSIKQGTTTEIIAVKDINWINAETPYVGIWVENKKYLYPATLSSILTKLDNDDFIRIHKSTIVNKSKIMSIHSRSNGDYDIKLNDNTLLRLSRNYRKEFNTQLK